MKKALLIVPIVLALAGAGLIAYRAATRPQAQAKPAEKQLWTCGMHPQVIQDHPGDCPICHMKLTPLQKGHGDDAHGLTIDPTVVQNMGVRVATVTQGPLKSTIRAVGILDEPAPAIRDITLKVSGWIEKLYADVEGTHIDKGDPLFELYSPELTVGVEESISARKSNEEFLIKATRRKLERWGLDAETIERLSKENSAPRTVTWYAPISGHAIEKDVVSGSSVQAGQRILRLSDNSTMWLEVQVFERQFPLVKIGQKAFASIEAMPGKTLEGEVIFIHPHLDETTRAAMVRFTIPNPTRELRKGMYATVELGVQHAEQATLVPREAVIDTGRRQLVFVDLGGGKFEPRVVKVGMSGADGAVEVLEGLSPGDEVVTSGQFLLDAESRIKEAIQKHLSH